MGCGFTVLRVIINLSCLPIFGRWSDLFTADAIDQWFENFHHYEVTLVSFYVSNSLP